MCCVGSDSRNSWALVEKRIESCWDGWGWVLEIFVITEALSETNLMVCNLWSSPARHFTMDIPAASAKDSLCSSPYYHCPLFYHHPPAPVLLLDPSVGTISISSLPSTSLISFVTFVIIFIFMTSLWHKQQRFPHSILSTWMMKSSLIMSQCIFYKNFMILQAFNRIPYCRHSIEPWTFRYSLMSSSGKNVNLFLKMEWVKISQLRMFI